MATKRYNSFHFHTDSSSNRTISIPDSPLKIPVHKDDFIIVAEYAAPGYEGSKKYLKTSHSMLKFASRLIHDFNGKVRLGIIRKTVISDKKFGVFNIYALYHSPQSQVISEILYAKLDRIDWPTKQDIKEALLKFLDVHHVPQLDSLSRTDPNIKKSWYDLAVSNKGWQYSPSPNDEVQMNHSHGEDSAVVEWIFDHRSGTVSTSITDSMARLQRSDGTGSVAEYFRENNITGRPERIEKVAVQSDSPSPHEAEVQKVEVVDTLILESYHPYNNSSEVYERVRIPGATSYMIAFDEHSAIEPNFDFIRYTSAMTTQFTISAGFYLCVCICFHSG